MYYYKQDENGRNVAQAQDKRAFAFMPQYADLPVLESETPVEIWQPDKTVEEQLEEACAYLQQTGYIAEKIAEAQLHGRNTASLKTEYSAVLTKREAARVLIRKLRGQPAETALSALPAAPVPAAPKTFPQVFMFTSNQYLPAGGSWAVWFTVYGGVSVNRHKYGVAGGTKMSGDAGMAIRIA